MSENVDTMEAEANDESFRVREIIDWMAREIIEARLLPGDDLNSVDLARRFKVSRTPVREALFVMSRSGLVDWPSRKRPRVAAIRLKDVRELYQLRAILYGQISTAIVEQAGDEALERLWAAHRKLADAAARGDVDGYFWANVAFRDEELRACGNGIFREVLESMRLRVNRLRRLSTSLPGRLQRSCADHERLCQAYRERDGVLAAALNRSIVLGALQSIEQAWDSLPFAERQAQSGD
ncbi:GntR family transcriptional regulator [Burkholderia sp. 22PA0106]|uniref:GntR family transcriptional regulator n=1 Tax=Burkholderia sp. 22PA0106 TaxID=3237371 RepID=UPI0039C02F4E